MSGRLTATTDPGTAELYRQELVREDVRLFLQAQALARAAEEARGDRQRGNVDAALAETQARRADVARELVALPVPPPEATA